MRVCVRTPGSSPMQDAAREAVRLSPLPEFCVVSCMMGVEVGGNEALGGWQPGFGRMVSKGGGAN